MTRVGAEFHQSPTPSFSSNLLLCSACVVYSATAFCVGRERLEGNDEEKGMKMMTLVCFRFGTWAECLLCSFPGRRRSLRFSANFGSYVLEDRFWARDSRSCGGTKWTRMIRRRMRTKLSVGAWSLRFGSFGTWAGDFGIVLWGSGISSPSSQFLIAGSRLTGSRL
jgi:hypothetical protein